MEKHPLVRTIYLYLFALVGLVFLISGMVRFLDMGLKIFIFKQAEAPERFQQQFSCQYYSPLPITKLEANQASNDLTADEQTTLKNFLENYKKCQEEGSKIDYLTANRQREASGNLAMILVGFPLYFYHWRIIGKESKKREEDNKRS